MPIHGRIFGMKIIQDVVFNHTSNFGEEGLNELGGSVGALKAFGVYSIATKKCSIEVLKSKYFSQQVVLIGERENLKKY